MSISDRQKWPTPQDMWPVALCKLSLWALLLGVVFLLISCAGTPVVETRTNTATITIPKTVPCFKDSDIPVPPASVRRRLKASASTDQIASATVADVEAYGLYISATQGLWEQCKGAVK
jgi:hypothetical protein